MNGMIEPALVCAVALLLDQVLGEPRRWHPVVGFGNLASRLEWRLNRHPGAGLWRGLLAVTVLIVPLTLMAWMLICLAPSWLVPVLEVIGLWLALSLRGLREHGLAVVAPLERHDLDGARKAVGGIVSRNAARLDEQIGRAVPDLRTGGGPPGRCHELGAGPADRADLCPAGGHPPGIEVLALPGRCLGEPQCRAGDGVGGRCPQHHPGWSGALW